MSNDNIILYSRPLKNRAIIQGWFDQGLTVMCSGRRGGHFYPIGLLGCVGWERHKRDKLHYYYTLLQLCWCEACRPMTMEDMRFIVCPLCGNKRCPKASNHIFACTDSNETGQVGTPE